MRQMIKVLIACLLISGSSGKAAESVKGSAVFLEIATIDLARSSAFYANLLGWTFEDVGTPGSLLFQAPNMQGRFEFVANHPGGASVVPYFQVARLRASFDQAIQLGAEQIVPPTPSPGRGSIAIIRDLDKNRIGLFSTELNP